MRGLRPAAMLVACLASVVVLAGCSGGGGGEGDPALETSDVAASDPGAGDADAAVAPDDVAVDPSGDALADPGDAPTEVAVDAEDLQDLAEAGNDLSDPSPVDVPAEAETASCTACADLLPCLVQCAGGTAGAACRQACLANPCLQTQGVQALLNALDRGCDLAKFSCTSAGLYADCIALNQCIAACPSDNPATPLVNEKNDCDEQCFVDGTYNANLALGQKVACLAQACPICATAVPGSADVETCNSCQATAVADGGACRSQYEACRAHGVATCAAVATCVIACADSACMLACVDSGTLTAQALLSAWSDCATAACPSAPIGCEACTTQWTACQNDA